MQKAFSEQLRDAIEKSELSRYRIAKLTGIPASQLSRFANHQAGLSIDSIDAICKIFGARLVVEARPKPRPKRKHK